MKHRCAYPLSGCTAPDCQVSLKRSVERTREVLMSVSRDFAVQERRGESVRCGEFKDPHSEFEHELHLSRAQSQRLFELNLLRAEYEGE